MNGMRIQAQQYVKSTGADIWISAEGSGGAFIGFSLLDEEHMAFLKASPGLVPNSASPLIFRTSTTQRSWKTHESNGCWLYIRKTRRS